MGKRPYDIERCKVCRYRGYLDYDTQLCCNYMWITGKARILLPKREDGQCPAYEPGEQEFSQITQIAVHVPTDRPMYKYKFDKDQMQALYDEGMNDREIAMELGCHEKTVGLWRRREGLPGNGARKKCYYDPEVFLAMYNKGYSDNRMSMLTGYHTSIIAAWRKSNHLPPVSRGGKEPEIDRKKMRELYDQGMFDSQIAHELGCSDSAVRHWRMRAGLPAQTKREDLK